MALQFGNLTPVDLLNDENFVLLINQSVPLWLDEFKEVIDKRVLLDLIKYRIRQVT